MLRNYVKVAFKVLLRRKFFTFISLFAISFTLIVLMVAVALLDHVVGPLPVETRWDRTLGIAHMQMTGPQSRQTSAPGYGFLNRYARNLPNVEQTSFFSRGKAAYSYKDGQKIKSYLKRTDGEYWQILDFTFIEGAPFTPDDERNASFVAVINEATRRKFFDDQPAVGQTLEIDGQRFRVVGVVANVPGFSDVPFADVWVPISTSKTRAHENQFMGGFGAMIVARSSADIPAIKEEFQSRLARVELPDPKTYKEMSGLLETHLELKARLVNGDNSPGSPARLIATVLIAMVLFMLLPTINLININVSRILERASEIGVRKAFGASSWTLVGQFIVENVLITLVGGVIGFLGSLAVLAAISQSGVLPYAEFGLNYRIFLFGLLIALFFGLFSGVYPAWKMSRLHPVQALKGGVR